MNRMILGLCIVIFAAHFVHADTVRLKSGETVSGDVSEQTQDYVKIKVEGVDLTYWVDEIEEVRTGGSLKQADSSSMIPLQVYTAYADALEKNDWQGMKKYLSKSYIEANVDKNGAPLPKVLKKFKSKDLKIAEHSVKGSDDKFMIVIGGETSTGKERLRVKFEKEDGAWKITDTGWMKGERQKARQ